MLVYQNIDLCHCSFVACRIAGISKIDGLLALVYRYMKTKTSSDDCHRQLK